MGQREELHESDHEDTVSNELLDLFGPAAVSPVVVVLFWGSAPADHLITYAILHSSLTIIFGTALWLVARHLPQHYGTGETVWTLSSGVLAATLPWVILPATQSGYFALGLIFAAIMASDTLFIALRPNPRWKTVLALNTISYSAYLCLAGAWPVAFFCATFGVHLIGGHDAIQNLVQTLRVQRSHSHELARRDPLTGLSNRRALTEFIERSATEPGSDRLVVAAIDIDNFKQINDRLGHHGGDVALVGLARHMTESFGDDWLVVRSGGDEFVCVSRTGTFDEARAVLRRIPSRAFEDNIMRINVSVGLAEGSAHETLLADASAALRLSKHRGKHRVTEVDDELRAELREARRLGGQLAKAVQKGEIEIWAQPIVHLIGDQRGEIHSFECLARWSTPEGLSIPPSTFIPMIEDQRLTRELGESVIVKAAEFARCLPEHISVSVNVSASHFTNHGFAEFVHATLDRHDLAPHRLTIEITETEEAEPSQEPWAVGRQLRAMGVGLSIDDFGTGYGSLERLMQFPCTQLKLDRSIVANASGTGLVHILAGFGAMSRESGVEIVAEGIENETQAQLLTELGVPLAQGYLFGYPRPIRELAKEYFATFPELTSDPAAELTHDAEPEPAHQPR